MISRVADHCFWLGRYLERADSTARVLFVTRNLALDAALSPGQCWLPVVNVSGELERFSARFGPEGVSDGEKVQHYMTWDERNPVSIRQSVASARENARSIREVVSLEVWETINELNVWVSGEAGLAEYQTNRYAFYRRFRQSTQLALGVLRSTMLHDTPLDFIWLGVLLERLGQTARTLDVHHQVVTTSDPHRVVETALWLSFLKANSGFEPFMKRHQGRVTRDAVASFLILDPQFPRSVHFCARHSHERLAAMRPPDALNLPGGKALERLTRLRQTLEETYPIGLAGPQLHGLLTGIVDGTSAVCDLIGEELLGRPAPTAAGSQAQ